MSSGDVHQTKSAPIAGEVQRFYDRHRYPPPVKDLDAYHRLWQDDSRRRADYHLHWPAKPYQADYNILVAGCGTSQAARHAMRQPAARVVGIDFSSTSIEHTEALKRQYHLGNLEICRLPIERSYELGERFDQIICTGVLRHLPDPDAGLRALRRVLKPDGAMHLMVYAAYGRIGIYMLQEYCRRLGLGLSAREIRDLANTLMALAPEHPLARLLAETPDFRTKAWLADALLHPQDRAYTVPQLFEFIDRADLTFGRWLRQAPYLPQCGALAKTPHAACLCRLSETEQYAAAELFRGTTVRHNLILYHSDRPGGAAALLINQHHTYPDLVLPVEREQKQLYDAIDGRHSIGEILKHPAGRKGRLQNWEGARLFFQQLWWYDQIVFDTSQREAFPAQ